MRNVGNDTGGMGAPASGARTARTTSAAPATSAASAETTPEDQPAGDAVVEAATPLGSDPARYIAAGVLSIVAVALALAIAVVAQPRRPRRTH